MLIQVNKTRNYKHFMTNFIFFFRSREQTNKRRVKEIVKEFSLLCRGLQGSGH